MAESRSHLDLVQIALEYIKGITPSDAMHLIQVDSPDTHRPLMVGAFIPDVYLETSDLLIIGEAKTLKDFDTKHSVAQYKAYIERCDSFPGERCIVVSVPWQLTSTAKNLFRRLTKEQGLDIKVVVINELGKAIQV